MKINTQEEFDDFINLTLPCELFHVMPLDKDDNTGGRLEEEILIRSLNENPGALKFKPLIWFINTFLK